MRMTSVMKNDQVTRQCAVSLSNLASGSMETHEHIVGDGGITALVELASHGLIVDESEETNTTKQKNKQNDEDAQDWSEEEDTKTNALTPMSTLLTRVAPRVLRKIETIEDIDQILPVLDKGMTKTMASDIDGITTARTAPPSPNMPTLVINSTENSVGQGEEEEEEQEDDTSLGAAQGELLSQITILFYILKMRV